MQDPIMPPPLPKSGANIFQTFASFCIWSPLISIVANIFVPKIQVTNQTDALVNMLIASAVPVLGILSGLVALFGMIRWGRAGILWKSVVGLLIWAILIAASILILNTDR